MSSLETDPVSSLLAPGAEQQLKTDPASNVVIPVTERQFTMVGDSILPEIYHLEGGGNFGVWAYRMKNMLLKDGRFHYCLTPPSKVMSEAERVARQQVLSIINSNAKNNALKLLRRYSDPHECWSGLKTRYESDSGPRRVMLIEKFFSLRKTESVSMDTYLTEVKEITNLLEEVEVVIPEDIIVYYTLKNLPKEYEIFKRMQISAQSLPSYEQLEAKLISEETSIKMEGLHTEDGEALLLHQNRNSGRRFQTTLRYNNQPAGNQRNDGNHRNDGHHRNQRRGPDSGGSSMQRTPPPAASGGSFGPRSHGQHSNKDGNNNNSASYQPRSANYTTSYQRGPRGPLCNYCGETGHFEVGCDLMRSILDRIKNYELRQRRNRNYNGQVNHIEEPADDFKEDTEEFSADQVIDACLVELNMLETPSKNASWYLDSGATHHVSGDPEVFSAINRTNGAQVRSAGGQTHSVSGVGDVDFRFLSGEIKTIPSVLYTPGITKNLLSVGSLTDQQKTLVFRHNGCFVVDNATQRIEAFAEREHTRGLYKLQATSFNLRPEINTLQLHSQATLWHKRLGHFHARGMQRMLQSGAVRGMPSFKIPTSHCTGCHLGKHAKTKMPKAATYHAKKILELVHSDVCGPFKICSIGGARYFLTFVDDFSRKTWIYFLSHKSQVLEKFKHLVRMLKTSTGRNISALRTDNGGEYISTAFRDFCSSQGIVRELTPPHTPQRNGIAERRNRSILDITRCLLLDKQLPGHLWAEAVKAAVDILNLRSTKRHPTKTPTELFSGKKPSISHLRIFGSPAFAHIPKPSRTKLDPRSEQCILLSFDETVKAYRCYRPSTRKIFVSRDIAINEDNISSPLHITPPLSTSITADVAAPTRTEESWTLPPPQKPATSPTVQTDRPFLDDPTPLSPPAQTLGESSSTHTHDTSPTTLPPPPTAPLRRSDRIRKFPRHLQDFAASLELDATVSSQEFPTEPLTYQQAHNDYNWKTAMEAEIASINNNSTWTLVELPPGKKAISSRWIYKLKPGSKGSSPRYKARLVARGFEQKDGIDFFDTFAPVVRWETIRILLAIATHLNWPVHQLDVLTAFLNGILQEDVYMNQPLGFVQKGAERLVCKLHKSLYGLRQSPRAWYARLHTALLAWGLTQSHSDPNLYFSHVGNHTIALLVYVDDILITGSHFTLIAQLKQHLHNNFKTNDLGPIHRYLGVQFDRTPTGLRMHQTDYALSILHLFNMESCSPSHTPLPEGLSLSKDSATPPVDATLYRMLVGKLLFLTKTRPDITHAVSVVSRFMQSPQEAHLQAAKHVLRYVRRYPDLGLFFKQGEENLLHGYTDADYGQDVDDRISVGAYIFFLGSSPISWNSKKQSTTSRSSCESEYRALAQCSCEAVWIRRLLEELKILDNQPTHIFCDNQSSIKLSHNPVFHERSKHFEIDCHFTRQKVEDNSIKVEYISSQEQPADLLTKPLGRVKFETCRQKLHLCSNSILDPYHVTRKIHSQGTLRG